MRRTTENSEIDHAFKSLLNASLARRGRGLRLLRGMDVDIFGQNTLDLPSPTMIANVLGVSPSSSPLRGHCKMKRVGKENAELHLLKGEDWDFVPRSFQLSLGAKGICIRMTPALAGVGQ